MKRHELTTGLLGVLLAMVLAILAGCNRAAPQQSTLGDAKATVAFWNALHEPLSECDGCRVLQLVSASNPDSASQHYITSCLRGCAAVRRTQCEQIALIPLHRVDPDAAAYGIELVKLRLDTVSLAEAIAQAMDDPTGLPEGGGLLLDLLVSLGRHANDQDGVWLGALKDQAVARSNDVGQAMDRARTLVNRATELQERMTSLKTTEMSVRMKLAERYDREFPAYVPRDTQPLAVDPGPGGSPRGSADIQRDLLGRSLGSTWSFDNLGEFRALDITGSVTSGQLAIVEVLTAVKGWMTGREQQLRLRLLYQASPNGWQLAVVEQIQKT